MPLTDAVQFTPRFDFMKEPSCDHDLTALQPKFDFNRRDFVVTSLATGFALAVQPVSAETITTDTEGLKPAR